MRPTPAPPREVTVHSDQPIHLRQLVVPHEDLSDDMICLETRTVDGHRLGRQKFPKEGFSMAGNRDLLRDCGPLPILLRARQAANWDVQGLLFAPLPTEPPSVLHLGVVLRLSFERKHRGRLKWEAQDLLHEVLAGKAEEPAERISRHLTAPTTQEEE